MQKQPFSELVKGPRVELRRPIPALEYAAGMHELLMRNDFFYPRRLSLRRLPRTDT